MAHLGEPIWPDVKYETSILGGEEYSFPVNYEDEGVWIDEQLANQPTEGIKGCFVSFPVGDGSAIYKITSLRPLTMNPVMLGDRWEIPDAYLRGLNKRDLEDHVARERALKEIFGQKRDTKPKRRRPRERNPL